MCFELHTLLARLILIGHSSVSAMNINTLKIKASGNNGIDACSNWSHITALLYSTDNFTTKMVTYTNRDH